VKKWSESRKSAQEIGNLALSQFPEWIFQFSGPKVEKPDPKWFKSWKWAKKVAKIDLFLRNRKKVKKRRPLAVTNIFMPDFRHAHTLQQSLY